MATARKDAARRARLDKLIAGFDGKSTTQQLARIDRAQLKAERRIAGGIGVHVIHVLVEDVIMDFELSDELALLSRAYYRVATAHDGEPVVQCFERALIFPREIVRAGGLADALIAIGAAEDAENEARRMQFLGIAKRALAKLYDDMILRAYHPSDEAPIVGVEETETLRSLFPHAPADEYWLLLDAGGKVPGFTIGVEPPIVVDGQLRMRT
jgi:hypothetical protein